MIKINVKNNFNLHDTVTCGQIFRFVEESDNSYTIIIKDRVIIVKQDGTYLYVKSNNYDNLESIVLEYFDLNRDYDKINEYLISHNSDISDVVLFEISSSSIFVIISPACIPDVSAGEFLNTLYTIILLSIPIISIPSPSYSPANLALNVVADASSKYKE